ncbi:hypothetical protein WJX73_003147 [Symbiochloris irregularis]|uniref:Splicing factor Cactin n=1 Tax=Symbiochloris irregularis TaxID=706552 RepID=A0AAW1NSK8_9CHLO
MDKHSAAAGEGEGTFVWRKKVEKQVKEGVSVREIAAKAGRDQLEERQREVEKVRKRKADREAEKAAMEEEQAMLARERAYAENLELQQKEEEFHLEQAKQRAINRLREQRPKAIDLLARTIHLAEEFGIDAEPPYALFDRLTLTEIRDLARGIQDFKDLDSTDEEHAAYWAALSVVCGAEEAKAERQDEIDRARLRGEPPPPAPVHHEPGLHGSVAGDLDVQLAGKSYGGLQEMQKDITSKLQSGRAPDPEFLTVVLSRMDLAKAKARLRETHEERLRRHVEALEAAGDPVDLAAAMGWDRERAEQDRKDMDEELQYKAELEEATAKPEDDSAALPGPAGAHQPHGVQPPGREDPAASDDDSDEEFGEENVGQWSPAPIAPEEIVGVDVIAEEDDLRLLELHRAQVRYTMARKFKPEAALQAASRLGFNEVDRQWQAMLSDPGRAPAGVHPMMRYVADAAPQQGEVAMRAGTHSVDADANQQRMESQAARLMGDMADAGDAPFGGEVALQSRMYWWHDKYRPRKPKYFNRVHTGYEWNKYNQTHYDHDNPPPKVVQGYKFNIFYPDLIDKSEAPTYAVEKDTAADEQGSTCLLRFHAGPPYEDTAFRIINKEWEYSHKKGFKSSFERGILHLYFNFKRQRYRR